MQKDIRHYDMKDVEFEQDRSDRRFLTLEVGRPFTTLPFKEKSKTTICTYTKKSPNLCLNSYEGYENTDQSFHKMKTVIA